MIQFDYNRHDAVGIAIQMGLTNNASVLAIGMVDRSSGEFIPVPASERNKVFPTRGYVFAYDFFKHNPNWKDECVCLCAKPNNNENIVDGEDFVWDWKDKPYIYGDKLLRLSKQLTDDGQENFDILDSNGILDTDKLEYFISGDRIYRYDLGQRLIPYWNISTVSTLLFFHNGNVYLLDDITTNEDGKVDLTTEDQLIEWYKKKILRKEWGKIYEAKDFRVVDDLVTSELKTLKIPTNVFESRLGRVMSMAANLSLTFEELEDLSTTPWFKDTIEESIESFADRYLKKLEKEVSNKIKDLNDSQSKAIEDAKSKFKSTMEELDLEIEIKKEELENINSRITEESENKKKEIKKLEDKINEINNSIDSKNAEIERLDSRKADILADYAIIKEVLGTAPSDNLEPIRLNSLETIDDGCEMEMPVAAPFRKNIESYLVKYLGAKIDSDEIMTRLSSHKILLLPDDSTVSAIMHATRRCKFMVEYVSVSWKSFSDLWDNGLRVVVESASSQSDMIHFLVLRDINLSYIPSYLHPVLDMQNGICNHFPGTDMEFPENLRILCTRTPDLVIPITPSALESIGCITPGDIKPMRERKERARNLSESSFVERYLPASIFEDLPENEKYMDDNPSDTYIDEK